MLIEFSVANYRSFRERQTLSMVAAPRLGKKENTFTPALDGEKFPDLLKAIAIYGPNASGKSNLLRALSVVDQIANQQPTPHPTPLPAVLFGLDPALADMPSVFELHFICSGLRYSFELSATASRIVGERLTTFPRGKDNAPCTNQASAPRARCIPMARCSSKRWSPTSWTHGRSSHRRRCSSWLRLSPTAVASSGILRLPFEWLSGAALSLMDGMSTMIHGAQDLISKRPVGDYVASFLRELDVPVSRVTVAPIDKGLSLQQARPLFKTTFTHRTALGEADIAFEDESEGTKSLFGFWLPWVSKAAYEDSTQCLLVVDEIDSSLHPKIVEALVAKHHNAPRVSQLLFTTHDTHLMDSGLLRRDQIWITERDANGATRLLSIHDFKGRQSEDIESVTTRAGRGLPLTTKG